MSNPSSNSLHPDVDYQEKQRVGLIESMLFVNGHFPFLLDHLTRLKRGAELLKINLPEELLNKAHAESYLKAHIPMEKSSQRLKVRLQLLSTDLHCTISFEETPNWTHVDLILIQTTEAFNSYPSNLKTTDREHYSRWLQLAREKGSHDALISIPDTQSGEDRLVETTIGNVLVYKDGSFILPKDSDQGIEGIFIDRFRHYAEQEGISFKKRSLLVSEIAKADGMWLCNAVRGPIPVRTIDGRRVPQSEELNQRMTSIFDHFTQKETKQHVTVLSSREHALTIIRQSRQGNNQQRELDSESDFHNSIVFLDGNEWGNISKLDSNPSGSVNRILFSDFLAYLEIKNGKIRVRQYSNSQSEDSNSGLEPSLLSEEQIHEIELNHDPWIALQQFRRALPGFHTGYLGYDLKNYRETLHSSNKDPLEMPDLWIGYPRHVMMIEEDKNSQLDQSTLTAFSNPESSEFHISNLESQFSEQQYIHHVQEAQERIQEGDYYEINLSLLFSGDYNGDALDLYQRMSAGGNQPFSAYLSLGAIQICSGSPERFMLKKGRSIYSSPMKGTAPRSSDALEDHKQKQSLIESEKERAENLMIVDLVRNDFSRVCTPGTVKVTSLFEVNSYPTVHQMISTVTGELLNQNLEEEAIASCFPMGSMTGAPKISAMEDIENLEDYKRGVYSGAIGYFSPEGDFDFNVVIRTAFCRNDGTFIYPAGSAITSDADPKKEWEEILLKTAILGLKH